VMLQKLRLNVVDFISLCYNGPSDGTIPAALFLLCVLHCSFFVAC
jgi:hypothetical protein